MARQEMCKLVEDRTYKKGIFGEDFSKPQSKFRIVQETPTGSITVYEGKMVFGSQEIEHERSRLQAKLLAEGWNLVESTYRFREELHTRDIPDSQPSPSNGKEDLFATIERLAHLRDIGAITEDEFQKKKNELMQRI